MKWHPQAYPSLLEANYPAVAQFYEQLVETEPEEVTYYWHLGLAYLLQQQEEEAQTTWLLVISQGDEQEVEQWTEELVEILETEAQRQEALAQIELSWLIRGHIREINPTLINNLLHLIELEIRLNSFTPEHLNDWQVIELLQDSSVGEVDSSLLSETLAQVLEFPYSQAVQFLEVSFPHLAEPSAFVNQARAIAAKMAYQRRQYLYAVEILQVCLKYEPDDLLLFNGLYSFFCLLRNYDRALDVAHQFNERCTTTPLKLYGNYLLLGLFLRRGAWLEIQPTVERHKQLLQAIIQQPPQALEPILSETLCLLLATNPFAYLQDNPVETHGFQNHIARLLQQTLQSRTPLPQSVAAPTRSKDPQKPLKIGYIAHSLCKHSVGYLCRWLFHYHDREAFHLSIYLVNQNEDELTEQWFRANADRAYNFLPDRLAIATQIQQDEIDILIDLDSITHGVTCQVMALKPAPVQVTWLGKDASGLPAIDYFIADPHVLPNTAQDYYQAKIWRLPHTYIAVDGFEVGVPTLRREQLDIPDGAIAYLSLQNAWKLHPETIRLQMNIIRAVPNSYLLIKGIADEAKIQQLFTQIAEGEGVSPEKLRFLKRDLTSETHRANLAIADVVLDTYPYNGATTTLEVLWMGIPVVTRVGEQFAARNSYAFMTNAGLTEGIAWSDEEYVEWGIRLGKDEELRQQIAWKLRASRQTSPLWNARQFTKEMEKAYQQMWAESSKEGLLSQGTL